MDDIIHQIIEYNKDIQISTSINLYKNTSGYSRPMICNYVSENSYEAWNYFYTVDNNKNLFLKGYERLKTWIHLFNDKPSFYFNKEIYPITEEEKYLYSITIDRLIYFKKNKNLEYLFILSALIIIFQVFGDGNHRTAKYFMKINGGLLTKKQEEMINNILRINDYYSISMNPIKKMNEIIVQLININKQMVG
jgi:prophage maintenance system killer protein